MGYFPNATTGELYQIEYCSKCKNLNKKTESCPIWDLHLLYSYKLCNSKSLAKRILDLLIPVDKETQDNKICSMFLKDDKNE